MIEIKHKDTGKLIIAVPGNTLTEVDLSDETLRYADLSEVDLTGANLDCSDLSNADLTNSNLSEANLTCAILTDADLSGADLTGAILSEADLTGANLTGVDLSGVDLTDVDLSNAKTTNAIFPPKKVKSKRENNIMNIVKLDERCTQAEDCAEVLKSAADESWKEVIFIGVADDGTHVVDSSTMSVRDVVYLLEDCKHHIITTEDDE